MPSEPPDGGPAFPKPDITWPTEHDHGTQGDSGMSLRDWFVGQMLAGRNGWATDTPKVYYERADKLIAEKAKSNGLP